jgi:RNA polymerase sigma-70 factor (ECF subfamily)
MARLMSTLTPRQRAILSDVKLTGLTVQEASDRAGVSLAAGKVIVHRAMKALARRVGRED